MKRIITVAVLTLCLSIFGMSMAWADNAAVLQVDDATLTSQAKEVIAKDADAKDSVTVTVNKGEVVISGSVKDREVERRLVDNIIKITGVRSMTSTLVMASEPGKTPPVPVLTPTPEPVPAPQPDAAGTSVAPDNVPAPTQPAAPEGAPAQQ